MTKHGEEALEKIQEILHEHKYIGKFKNQNHSVAVGISQARVAGDNGIGRAVAMHNTFLKKT